MAEKFAQPSDVFRVFAYGFGRVERDIGLYARFLREGSGVGGAWPAISAGRRSKFEVTPRHAIVLLLALATSSAARTCADSAEQHAALTSAVDGHEIALADFLAEHVSAADAEITLAFSPPWADVSVSLFPVIGAGGHARLSSDERHYCFRHESDIAFGRDVWFARSAVVNPLMLWELAAVFWTSDEIHGGAGQIMPWRPGAANMRGLIPPRRQAAKPKEGS